MKLLFVMITGVIFPITFMITAVLTLAPKFETLHQSNVPTSLIAFFTPRPPFDNNGIGDLVILNPATRQEQVFPLAPGWTEPTYLAWSPDYHKLLITYNAGTGGFYEMAALDVGSGGIETLASDPYDHLISGSYSPDGTETYFRRSIISATTLSSTMYLLPLENEIGQAWRINEDDLYSLGGSWSPVQGRLALTGYYREGAQSREKFGSEIFLVDLATNIRVNITKSPYQEYFASWSPDGASFIYISDETGKQELYLIDRNGQNNRRLTQTEDPLQAVYGQWTHESSKLIYITRRYTYSNNRNTPWKPMQFVLYDLDKVQQEVLIERNWIGGFDFSPDGNQFAYTTSEMDLGPSQLCVFDINTREEWCAEHAILPASAVVWGID